MEKVGQTFEPQKQQTNPVNSNLKTTSNSQAQIVRLISGEEKILIKALSGKKFRSKSKKIFKSFIGQGFANWEFISSKATKETPVAVGEIVKNSNFAEIFNYLNPDLDKLVFTQDQIIYFCEVHFKWLRQSGGSTFFLRKIEGVYVVSRIYILSNGIYGMSYRLDNKNYTWYRDSDHRVVYPISKDIIANPLT